MNIEINIPSELEKLVSKAAVKREILGLATIRKSRVKRLLTISFGVLALLSAGTIAAVITDVFDGTGVLVIAALTAGVSGIFSLILGIQFKDDDIKRISAGVSSYLSLRQKVLELIMKPNKTDDDWFVSLQNFKEEYASLDSQYSRLHPIYNIYLREMKTMTKGRMPAIPFIRKDVITAHLECRYDVEGLYSCFRVAKTNPETYPPFRVYD